MPTFQSDKFSNFYKRILQISQSSNTGIDATTRNIESGDGTPSVISMSDDAVNILPKNDDTTSTLEVYNKDAARILRVDTTNKAVKTGETQVNATTLFKEMGLHDFSPTAGVHNPLVCNNMMFSDSGDDIIEDTSMFGSGTDPATSLDLSADGTAKTAVACYWVIEQNMTLDVVRYGATADSNSTLNIHLFSYTLDTSSNHGDLSSGTVCANASVAATSTTFKTGTFTLDSADIDAGKVVIGFVENQTGTGDVTCNFNIQYHIR